MLVLGRKIGEVIEIGDDVEIMVVDIRDDHVRLGVQAPRQVRVNRKEIAEKIREQEKTKGRRDEN